MVCLKIPQHILAITGCFRASLYTVRSMAYSLFNFIGTTLALQTMDNGSILTCSENIIHAHCCCLKSTFKSHLIHVGPVSLGTK